MAAIVFFVNRARAQNRWLAALLIVDSTWALLVSTGRLLAPDIDVARGLYVAGIVLGLASIPIYVRFLSTLQTPWAGWLRHRFTFAFTWLSWAGLAASVLFVPSQDPGAGKHISPPGAAIFNLPTWSISALLVLMVVSIVVAVLAYRMAKPGLRKRQAAYYLAAFCAHDVIFLGILGFRVLLGSDQAAASLLAALIGYPAATLSWTLLLGYGLLKVHLFDIDLKVKAGAGRTIAVGAVAAAFFIVSETAERYFPFDGWIPGLLAAGVVALVFLPLQRATTRFLDRLMPASRDTPQYRTLRKTQVYRATFEDLAFGGITDKERRALETLRIKLGISAADAKALERDVVRNN